MEEYLDCRLHIAQGTSEDFPVSFRSVWDVNQVSNLTGFRVARSLPPSHRDTVHARAMLIAVARILSSGDSGGMRAH